MPIKTNDTLRSGAALMRMALSLHAEHQRNELDATLKPGCRMHAAQTASVALLSLARRGVYPARYEGSMLACTIQNLHQHWFGTKAVADDTNFAAVLAGEFLSDSLCPACLSSFSKFVSQLDAPKRLDPGSHFDDPLLPGWAYQSAIKFTANEKISPASTSVEMSMSIHEYNRRTQWFTPGWIASFLVEKTLRSAQDTFFDPACGAGHIYLPALLHMTTLMQARQDSNGSERTSAIASALAQVSGCDIDPFIVRLAGFSTYLFALDYCGIAELPLPRLFCLNETSLNEHRAISQGALLLGCEERQKTVLEGVDGSKRLSCQCLPDLFDAIATNPPYMSHRSMPLAIKELLSKEYGHSRYDLYTSFLELSSRLLKPAGRLAMICQQSFLSIKRFEEFRRDLFSRCDPLIVVQLGPGAFAAKSGEKANNAIVVLQKREKLAASLPGAKLLPAVERQILGLRVLSAEEKALAEEEGLGSYLLKRGEKVEFQTLSQISGQPLSFWCPAEIAALFTSHPPFESKESGIVCVNGLFTCNNDRFIKKAWKLDEHDRESCVPYDKGGGHKWFRITPYALRWLNHGDEIRDYRESRGQSRSLPGEAYYFQPGVTYSYINTRGFKARLLSPGAVFDIASSAVFCASLDCRYIVAFLNSALVRFLLGVLNPTINFQIGDLRRLPFRMPDEETASKLISAADRAIDCARKLESIDPSSTTFTLQFLRGSQGRVGSYCEYIEHCRSLDEIEASCQQEVDLAVFNLYEVSKDARRTICQDPWVVRGQQQLCKTMSEQDYHRALEKLHLMKTRQASCR